MSTRESRLLALCLYFTAMFMLAFRLNPYMILFMAPLFIALLTVSEDLD